MLSMTNGFAVDNDYSSGELKLRQCAGPQPPIHRYVPPASPTKGTDQDVADGGGVRGLSALYLLEQLMSTINEKAGNNPPLKPCDYFDMIGGTSTGGYAILIHPVSGFSS